MRPPELGETVLMDSKIRNKPAVIVVNMLKDMILHGKPFPMPPVAGADYGRSPCKNPSGMSVGWITTLH
jgi:hypothetical protein